MKSKISVYIFLSTFIILIFSLSSSLFALSLQTIHIGKKKWTVEIAQTPAQQRLGLGNRKNLSPNHGMLFTYKTPGERIFWMKGMQFAIDIIWIYKNTILHIEKDVSPPSSLLLNDRKLKTYGHSILADMVLELKAGESEKHRLKAGDKIRLSTP